VEALFTRAERHTRALEDGARGRALEGRAVANLFFESSTRTRMSFERAAKALGADVLNFTAQGSSVGKGETLLDTVKNIEAMGPAALVLRHASSGAAAYVASRVGCSVVNAGDGTHEHPSQGLLDAFTLRSRWESFEGRTVAIVGDVLHSRVARSNAHLLRLLGARVVLCGPATLLPASPEALGCEATSELDALLPHVDAVIMLRVQLERQAEAAFPSARDYTRGWGLTVARAERMKPEAVVLHPGPINRGVELSSEVADGPRSVILEQVKNGVAVRMAILERCVS
jgi:aspartate carbamoyltransferase catalytic subunit